MAFDGIVTKAIINELNNNIIGARIEKIYQINNNEIWFNIHGNRVSYKLLISIDPINARVHLSKLDKEKPTKAPQFCMVLRKHLKGAKIKEIKQKGLDRIIEIVFESFSELGDVIVNRLIVEIMGKHSNIILINKDGKIIDAIKHIDSSISSLREILPAMEYVYPTNQYRTEFLGMSLEQFISSVNDACMTPSKEGNSFSVSMANEFIGFSRTFTNNICEMLNIKEEITISKITEIYNIIILTLHNISQNLAFLINYGSDYHINIAEFSTHENSEAILSEFLDEFYKNKETIQEIRNKKSELQKIIFAHMKKLDKKLDEIYKILDEACIAENYKQFGELIYSNIYKIKKGNMELEVENYYKDNEKVIIPINPNLSPSKNSQNYFKKYSKLRSGIKYAESKKETLENEMNYLETVSFQINEVDALNEILEIKKELVKEKYIRSVNKKEEKNNIDNKLESEPVKYEMDGIVILVGKNNIQNEKLTFKIANKMDTWLHTKDIHGAHVVIRSDKVTDKVLEYAATIATKHSKAKGEGKVAVDYALIKDVHKLSGAKPGMVTYKNYKTIYTP